MESTKDTPETAASPAPETMTESAIPTVSPRICSSTSGITSARRESCHAGFFLINICFFVSMISPLFARVPAYHIPQNLFWSGGVF